MSGDTATPDSPLVHLEQRDDGVAVITLDNPKVNSLSTAVLTRLGEVISALQADLPGAVVVTGGPRIFAAGADIAQFGGPDEARVYGRLFLETFNRLAALPRATFAAISGYALGGGCELALACDFRIAADSAKLGQPEILLGIIPGGGGTQRLPRLVGPAVAKDLIFTGRHVSATEAQRIGLVDEVVPAADLLDHAIERAAHLASGAVVAQGLAKRAIDEGLDCSLSVGLELEQELFVEVFRTEDASIGVKSFLEHGPGKATFTGR
ncbi:MAG: enoyl-CoA hydratase-related protein [Acidimicrobiales bacterium]|nr:enoyl-CoA hydratase-related protein [Acidimicrobiales bacterium]